MADPVSSMIGSSELTAALANRRSTAVRRPVSVDQYPPTGIRRQGDDFETRAAKVVLKGIESRQFRAARGAPGGPDIHQNLAATIISKAAGHTIRAGEQKVRNSNRCGVHGEIKCRFLRHRRSGHRYRQNRRDPKPDHSIASSVATAT